MSNKLSIVFFILAVPLIATATATEYRTIAQPRQECWNEQVPVQASGQGYGGAIVGGLAGGIIGNQVGRGNGRTVATAVGAMTGAVVGDRMSSAAPAYQTVQRCRTVMEQVQTPVFRERVQYLAQPVPVIEQRVYYVEQEPPRYREHRRHGWHGRHHHHDDDD